MLVDSEFYIVRALRKFLVVAIERFDDGKIAESWVLRDDLGFLRQLGVVPERDST